MKNGEFFFFNENDNFVSRRYLFKNYYFVDVLTV